MRLTALRAAILAGAATALAGCVEPGVVRLVDGREVEGRFVSERAYALYLDKTDDPIQLARCAFGLAKGLVAAGGDRARARKIAERAFEMYTAAGGSGEADAKRVRAWITKSLPR